MKKILCITLSLILLLSLCGCLSQEALQAPVEFFYLRTSFAYGTNDGVITSELRESAGHMNDLRYMLLLYLQGPLDTNLSSPFPAGCRIIDIEESGDELTITLNANFTALQDMDLSLACVCLARTCMSLTDVQTVHIAASSADEDAAVSITIEKDSLLLEDAAVPSEPVTE